jgi:cytoskeletal protein CcmA (bactofilin family)
LDKNEFDDYKGTLRPSFISEGFEFIGDIKATAPLHIDGNVKGTIQTTDIHLDNNGLLEGEINVQNALIKGKANCILNTNNLTVGSSGKLEGTITYDDLQIQRGGVISGNFKKRS